MKARLKKKKRRKYRKYCRLYKYTCAVHLGGCGKVRHKRHFAKQDETLCPTCEKRLEINKNQSSLFEPHTEEPKTPNE